MLYLEDYLEMIEHLPQELRDRFTEMREMDLSVQNNMDSLEKRVRVLFSGCRRGEVSGEQASAEFSEIKKGYNRTLEDADEKVTLANQMYELVERYLRRLDSELHKFKCELEADNKGITELLEKRSLEMDVPSLHGQNSQSNHYKENRYRVRAEKRRDSWGVGVGGAPSRAGATALVAAPAPATLSRTDSAIQAALNRDASSSGGLSVGTYSLSHAGAGTAIAAAASQAIAATQQMQQGRRTASLKASLEAVNSGDLGLGRELAVAAHTAIQAAQHDNTHHHQGHHSSSHAHHSSSHQSSLTHHQGSSSNSNKRHKKKSTYSSSSGGLALAGHSQSASRSSSPSLGNAGISTSAVPASVAPLMEEPLTDGEWTYDPNEPRYCICNQVSYGDMVACDNEDCPFEWFHYQCVGITAPPKGKWYCPQCNNNMRRSRNNRKN